MSDLTTSKIEIRNVAKSFETDGGSVRALREVDLRIGEGEFVSIVGPSGCGKSTLLYVVGGFMHADGEVLIDGRPVTGPGTDRGVVFQEYALFPWLTVRKNILFGLERRGMPPEQREQVTERLIGVIGLRGFENRYPRELSGGMKQRVAIARTMACDPDILLLDEPFGALDAQTRELMQDELLRLWLDMRKTVLMITHDVTEAVYLSNRICVMSARPGQIVRQFDVDLDRSLPREELMLSEAFGALRNEVWLSVRQQAVQATEKHAG